MDLFNGWVEGIPNCVEGVCRYDGAFGNENVGIITIMGWETLAENQGSDQR